MHCTVRLDNQVPLPTPGCVPDAAPAYTEHTWTCAAVAPIASRVHTLDPPAPSRRVARPKRRANDRTLPRRIPGIRNNDANLRPACLLRRTSSSHAPAPRVRDMIGFGIDHESNEASEQGGFQYCWARKHHRLEDELVSRMSHISHLTPFSVSSAYHLIYHSAFIDLSGKSRVCTR